MMLLRNDGRARRVQPSNLRVRLLIVEQGAGSLDAYLSPEDCDEVMVIRQLEDETAVDLIARTCARISSLEFARKRIEQTVIVLAPVLDAELKEMRCLLGQTVLSHAHATGDDSELVLAIDAGSTNEIRQDLMDLVESLVQHPGSRRAPIRVRFATANEDEHAPPRSGIHLRPTAVAR